MIAGLIGKLIGGVFVRFLSTRILDAVLRVVVEELMKSVPVSTLQTVIEEYVTKFDDLVLDQSKELAPETAAMVEKRIIAWLGHLQKIIGDEN